MPGGIRFVGDAGRCRRTTNKLSVVRVCSVAVKVSGLEIMISLNQIVECRR